MKRWITVKLENVGNKRKLMNMHVNLWELFVCVYVLYIYEEARDRTG